MSDIQWDMTTWRAFIAHTDKMARAIHDWAFRKGFWWENRNEGECIALMHSELSEWLEGLRHGNPPDEHCPEFTSAEIEAADLIIRVLDTCVARGMRIGPAIIAKMAFNETRPNKHGKAF